MRMLRIRILAPVLSVFLLLISPEASHAFVDISVDIGLPLTPPVAIAPPPLPLYVIPEPPLEGMIWLPGYWHWGVFGYYWVPGTWVHPPRRAFLWTPGYWCWRENHFFWNEGYWGRHVGYYGGINYGGGYGGSGYDGGRWDHNRFIINRSVTNITYNNYTTVHNTASFNGGPGGTTAMPTAQENMAAREKHVAPTTEQVQHIKNAGNNPELRASSNHGRPTIAATSRPGEFTGNGVVPAKQAGPQNLMAERHNQEIARDPSLARGAALPKMENNIERQQANPERNNERRPVAPYPSTRKPIERTRNDAYMENRGIEQRQPMENSARQNEFRSEERVNEQQRPAQYSAPRKAMENSARQYDNSHTEEHGSDRHQFTQYPSAHKPIENSARYNEPPRPAEQSQEREPQKGTGDRR